MASVTLYGQFEDVTEVKLNKELQAVYKDLKTKYKDVCNALFTYDSKTKVLSLLGYINLNSLNQDVKTKSLFSFFSSNSGGCSFGEKEMPDEFYNSFYNLFPNMSANIILWESSGGTENRCTVRPIENGLEWEFHEDEDENDTVKLEFSFDGKSKVKMTKKLEPVYSYLKKNYKNVCKVLIKYDSLKMILSLPSLIHITNTDDNIKTKSFLAFINDDAPWSFTTEVLTRDFYEHFHKLFPNVQIVITLKNITQDVMEHYIVRTTKHGLEWNEIILSD